MATNEELERLRREVELAEEELAIERSLMLRDQEQPSQLEAGARLFEQGATFGAGDEIRGLYEGAKAFATTPGSLSERGEAFGLASRAQSAEERARLMEARRLFPKTSFGAEALGGTVTGGLVGRTLSPIFNRLSPAVRMTGLGAAEGATFGALSAEPGNRTSGAITGGLFGGAGGPLLTGAGVATANVLRPAVRRIGNALAGTPRDRAVREILGALEADDITRAEARQLLNEYGGPNAGAVLADLGPTTQRTARAVTSELGPAASRSKRFLDTRQREQQLQLNQAARRATAGSEFDEGIISVINNQESAAKPIYDEVFSEVIELNPVMLDLLERPDVKTARRKAARILQNEGFSADLVQDVSDVRTLDATKRALDDQISTARRAGRPNEARVLTTLKNELVSEVDSQVPRYAEARATFAGEAAMREAADLGRSAFSTKSRRTADAVEAFRNMNESEKQAARLGFLDWLRDELANQSVNRTTVAREFAEKPRFKEMVEALFPDQGAVDEFLQTAAAQNRFAETRNVVTGGSPTARIEADRAALSPGLAQLLLDQGPTPGGMIAGALRLIRGNTQLSPEVLDEMQKILFDPNIIPERALRTNPVVNAFNIPQLGPSTAAGAGGGAAAATISQLQQLGIIPQ